MNRNVETFIGCDSAYEDAGIVLFGAVWLCFRRAMLFYRSTGS